MLQSLSAQPSLSRRAVLGGALAAAAAIATGCSPVSKAPTGQRTDEAHTSPAALAFWKPPGQDPEPENAFFAARAKEFATAHDNDKVNHLLVPWNDALTKYTAAFGGGTAPDLSYLILLWLNQFSSAGALTALEDIDPQLDLTGFAPGPLESARGTDKKLYGMPYYSSRWCLAMNEDVWEAAGSPPLPTTYEELAAFAKKLTTDKSGRHPGDSEFDKKSIQTYGMTWSGLNEIQVNYMWNYFWAYGADYVSEDGKDIGFDNEGGRQVLELMRELQDSGATTPLTLYADPAKWGELIMTGKTGISWMSPPSASDFERFPKARLKVIDLPKGPAGQFVVGGVGYLCISSKCKYPQTALEYIKLLTNDANVTSYLQQTLVFPVRDSITEAVYDTVKSEKAKAFLTASLTQGPFLRLTRPLPYNGETYLLGEINNYLTGQKTLDKMIEDAHKQVATLAKNAGM